MRSEPSFSAENNPDNFAVHDSPFLDDYRQRYGLSCDPFADDPHFPFYTGAQRRVILEKLVHLCQFANNLLVVIGEYSTGKTRIAQALIDSLQDEDDICFLEGQVNSRFTDLLDEIVEQFELQSTDNLTDFFEKTPESEGVAVVIVDNAHHLDDETLRELVLLMRPELDSRLRVVFLGEPLLLQRLEKMDVSHVVMTDFMLERFELPDAVDYLNFRMEMSDYLGPEIFNETLVESWWRSANGQIDRLHACAQQKLLETVSSSSARTQLSGGFPIAHMLAVAVLAGILIMGFLYFGRDSDKAKKQSNEVLSGSASRSAQMFSAVASSISSVNLVSELEANEPNTNDLAEINSTAETARVKATSDAEEKPIAPPNKINSSRKNGESSVSSVDSANTDEMVQEVKQKTNASTARVKVNQVTSSPLVGSMDSENSKEKIQLSSDYTEQEKTILSWDDSEHTIQIVGLSSEKSAREFISHQSNREELLLFKTTRQGKDWFVVIYGHFATVAEAKAAVQSLPESQLKSTPWSRTVKIIKKEIRTR